MKKQKINPTRSQLNILKQICNFIPPHEVSAIARITGAEDKSRTFKPWSHVVNLVYVQIPICHVVSAILLYRPPTVELWGRSIDNRSEGTE